MKNNHIIKLMNPRVVELEIKLVTTRKTKKGTVKKLKQPKLWLNVAIELTEPLTPHNMYQDEHHQQWYAMPNPTDVIVIRNPSMDAYSFKMPTELIYAFSPAPMDSSAQPQIEKVTFDEDWLALNDTI